MSEGERDSGSRTATRVPVSASRRPSWGRILFQVAVGAAAIWLAWAGRGIWVPVGLAFVIALVLDPTVDRLENRGVPRPLATAFVFVVFLGLSALAIVLFSPGISAQAGQMAGDLSRLFPDPKRPDLVPATQKLLTRLDAHPALREALLNAARSGTTHLTQALQGASALVLAWMPNLAWFIVVPVLAFYTLNDFHRIYAKGILLVPARHRAFAQELISEISALFGKYLRGMAMLCLMLGVSSAALLFLLGNPYWQLLGLLMGVLYAVPVVGVLFTISLAVLVTFVTGSAGKALLTGGLLLALSNGLFDQVITPRVLGKQVGLHPIGTILALLLGYQVWGMGGMLVAVPVAAAIQTVIVHLIPKLGVDLELRPLEELKNAEEESRESHLDAESQPIDEHFRLQTVVENVE
jgi:predicted PurR-regulated permease PerM